MPVEISYQRAADLATDVDRAWLAGVRRGLFWLTLALAGLFVVNSFGLFGLIYYRLHIEPPRPMSPFEEPSPAPVLVLGLVRALVFANILLAVLAFVRPERRVDAADDAGDDLSTLLLRLAAYGGVASAIAVLLFVGRADVEDAVAGAAWRGVWGVLTIAQAGIVLGVGLFCMRIARRIGAAGLARRMRIVAIVVAATLAADSWLQGGVSYEPGDAESVLCWLQPAVWYLNLAGAALMLAFLFATRRRIGCSLGAANDSVNESLNSGPF